MGGSEYLPSQKRNFAEFRENWSTMSPNKSSCTCPLKVWRAAYFAEKETSLLNFCLLQKKTNLKKLELFFTEIPVFLHEFLEIFLGRLEKQTPTGAQRILFGTKSSIRRKRFFWFWKWWSLICNWGEILYNKDSKTYLLLFWWSHSIKDLNFQYEYLLAYFCNRALIKVKPGSHLLLQGRKRLHRGQLQNYCFFKGFRISSIILKCLTNISKIHRQKERQI